MNCRFCDKPCYVGEYDGTYWDNSTSFIYVCDRHPLQVKHYVTEMSVPSANASASDWHNTIVRFEYRGENWAANWLPGYVGRGPHLRIDKERFDGAIYDVIVDLPFHPPDLTPENLLAKVALYITFS